MKNLKKARMEYGIHPFFYLLKDDLKNLILLANEIDDSVHYTPGKMVRVKGIQAKIKIAHHRTRPTIAFLKLYGHKVVQSFFLEFKTKQMVSLFIAATKMKYPQLFID